MKKAIYFILRNVLLLAAVLVMYNLFDSRLGTRHGFEKYMPYISITSLYIWILVHNSLLLEKLLFKRKYIFYIAAFIVLVLSLARYELYLAHRAGMLKDTFIGAIVLCVIYTIFGTCFYFAYRYVMEKKSFYQLNSMKRDIELQQLKAQLNPHFLFNALNNIYSYTLNNNKFGNELILKLSELMRFIIDSSKKDTISISEEITFIENYIAFEKERLGDRCIIHYSKNVRHTERNLPPLILFPFIENAFKYGTNTIQKTNVEIILNDNSEAFQLQVKNDIFNEKIQSTKVGLPNVTRRLELLFPGRYTLDIKNENGSFFVDLTLKYHEKNQRFDR